MSDETPAPSCAKCGTPGVPSYIVLSPFMQYWRCPDCFCVWTTLKASAVHTRPFEHPLGSARPHCPQCGASDTTDLDGRLHSERVDYFRCRVCDCWWMVPKGQDGPATRIVFAKPGTSGNSKKRGCASLTFCTMRSRASLPARSTTTVRIPFDTTRSRSAAKPGRVCSTDQRTFFLSNEDDSRE